MSPVSSNTNPPRAPRQETNNILRRRDHLAVQPSQRVTSGLAATVEKTRIISKAAMKK